MATRLRGRRVVLETLGADAIGAMRRGDTATLEALTGLRWPPQAPPDLADHLDHIHAALVASPEDGDWWTRSICVQGRRDACGAVGLNGPPDRDGIVWIGYALYPEARGHGLATEAVATLIDRAFDDERVRAVLASIAAANHKSLAVVRRVGFRYHRRAGTVEIHRLTRRQWHAERTR